MKPFIKLAALAAIALGVFATSCKKDEKPTKPDTENPYAHLFKIGVQEDAASGLKISLYTDKEAFTGYNFVYAVVQDLVTNELIKDAPVQFLPIMDMGTSTHSCPVEQPVFSVDDKAYKGAAVFIMPSTAGAWYFTVEATNPKSTETAILTFNVNVIAPAQPKLYSFVSLTDGKKVFVALLEPRKPKTGFNDFNVAVFEKLNMLEFPGMDGLMLEIEPEMPSMGHGSPNNVNPTPTGNGHYSGKVNFTMTGYWKVNMTVKDAQGNIMDDANAFDITF